MINFNSIRAQIDRQVTSLVDIFLNEEDFLNERKALLLYSSEKKERREEKKNFSIH